MSYEPKSQLLFYQAQNGCRRLEVWIQVNNRKERKEHKERRRHAGHQIIE